MQTCDNPSCKGADLCERIGPHLHQVGIGTPCEWDGLIYPIINLPVEEDRITTDTLREHMSAYWDDLEYLGDQ